MAVAPATTEGTFHLNQFQKWPFIKGLAIGPGIFPAFYSYLDKRNLKNNNFVTNIIVYHK